MRAGTLGIGAVAATFAVAALTAGGAGLAAPTCAGADLHLVPQYAASTPGPDSPQAAVAALLDTGIAAGIDPGDLMASGAAGPGLSVRTDVVGDEHRVQVADDAQVLALARVLPHPAGGWRVEGLRACGQVAP